MQRHERDGVGVGTELVELRDEHRLLEEVIERRETDLAFLVGHLLRRAGDELAHVLEAIGRLGPFGAEVLVVADALDDLAQQLVDRRLARRLAEASR